MVCRRAGHRVDCRIRAAARWVDRAETRAAVQRQDVEITEARYVGLKAACVAALFDGLLAALFTRLERKGWSSWWNWRTSSDIKLPATPPAQPDLSMSTQSLSGSGRLSASAPLEPAEKPQEKKPRKKSLRPTDEQLVCRNDVVAMSQSHDTRLEVTQFKAGSEFYQVLCVQRVPRGSGSPGHALFMGDGLQDCRLRHRRDHHQVSHEIPLKFH